MAGQVFGYISDLILTKNLMPKGILRKIMQTLGFLLPAAGVGLLGYVINDWKISVAIMTIGYGFRGATYSGHTLVTQIQIIIRVSTTETVSTLELLHIICFF